MKSEKRFRVHFNKGKQWFDVYIADSQRKFMARESCYAYYQPASPRNVRRGMFGTVHFSKTGTGLVAHELLHLLIDWVRVGRSHTITERNEESVVLMFGEMVRAFWNKYYQWEKKTTL